jgi:hypothetical protein
VSNSAEPLITPRQRMTGWIWNSPRKWFIGLVLVVAAASAICHFGQIGREGKWLVGQWQHVHVFDDGTTLQRNLRFESNGRVRIANDYAVAGKIPHNEAQLADGRWTVRHGRLQIKWNRPIRKDVILAAARTQRFFHNLVTGQRSQIIDEEISDSRLIEKNANEFDVIWHDPFASADSETQSWSRVR